MYKSAAKLLGVVGGAIALAIWGFLVEPSLLTQRNLTIPSWPGPPLKVAFLTDLHAGSPHIDEQYLKNLVSKINAISPDLILIGGDLVIDEIIGGHPMSIAQIVSHLKNLKAPLGTFSVLGNHDWWNNGQTIRSRMEEIGIPVLDNAAKSITVDDDFHFWLVGIGDDYTNHADANLPLSQISSDAPRILLMHDPSAIFQVKAKFFLALAGHLHGGQVSLPGIGALITPGAAPSQWARGLVELEHGTLFVSKGIGTSIIPVRFNAPPEFVILDLKK